MIRIGNIRILKVTLHAVTRTEYFLNTAAATNAAQEIYNRYCDAHNLPQDTVVWTPAPSATDSPVLWTSRRRGILFTVEELRIAEKTPDWNL